MKISPGLPRKFTGTPRKVLDFTEADRKKHNLSTWESIVDVVGSSEEATDQIREACTYARTQKTITIDLETTGLNCFQDKIILCQIGDTERQWLLWWQTISSEAKELVRELWADAQVRKVGANLKFDAKFFLAQEGSHWRGARLVDTQICQQVLGCGLLGTEVGMTLGMTNMASCARTWLGLELPKSEEIRTGWGDMTPGVWYAPREAFVTDEEYEMQRLSGIQKRHYAADDCAVPIRVLKYQIPWLRELDLLDSVGLEMRFLPVLADMEIRGVPIDWDAWNTLTRTAERELTEAETELDHLFGARVTTRTDLAGNVSVTRDKNYASPEEMKDLIREWMHERYGIEVVCNNRHLRESALRHGMAEARVNKLLIERAVDDPYKPGKFKKVGAPTMSDYIEGSEFAPSRWKLMAPFLGENAFPLTSTDSDVLRFYKILFETPDELIDDHHEIPTKFGLPPELVDPVLKFREASTKVSRYGDSWAAYIEPSTGRVHTEYVQAAATTGRLTSSPNFQNIPADAKYREAVCKAPAGRKIVGADWSQIEPRIIAEFSSCRTYMRVFWSDRPGTKGFDFWCDNRVTEPLDLYGAVGAKMGILPPDAERKSVAKGKSEEIVEGRKQSKIVVLGLGYGTGKMRFWRAYILDTGVYQPLAKSNALYDAFWKTTHEVKTTLDSLSDIADPTFSDRCVFHPLAADTVVWAESIGKRKRYFRKDSKQSWTQGRNQPIQATGAEILKDASIELDAEFRKRQLDAHIVLNAHDELLADVAEAHADEAARIMEQVMSRVGERYCPHVPITAEAYVADHWIKD